MKMNEYNPNKTASFIPEKLPAIIELLADTRQLTEKAIDLLIAQEEMLDDYIRDSKANARNSK